METSLTQTNETREQLRNRLRQKISSKRTNRTNGITRKKNDSINDSLKKIGEVLMNKGIEKPEQLDATALETIMNSISKSDLELILEKMQQNSKFKEMLSSVNDLWNNNKEPKEPQETKET